MTLQRKSLAGFPPNTPPGSFQTIRLVPLTNGERPDVAWPLQAPGSAVSMINFLPLDGGITPRSRLSSLNTIRVLSSISGVAVLTSPFDDGIDPAVWVSGATRHGTLNSGGSISLASFTSAGGLGTIPTTQQREWQYAQVFTDSQFQNQLLAVGRSSADTVLSLYEDALTHKIQFSYLTAAPMASAIGVYDNYVIVGNTNEAGLPYTSRVRWCVRGEPENWNGEGAGFEDLLAMRGAIMAIWPTPDGRFFVFSSREIFYGVSAAYPAQFQFYPLDPRIGCEAPRTIQDTDQGVVFLSSDKCLRLIPRGGGASTPIIPTLNPALRQFVGNGLPNNSWAIFDQTTKLYHLFLPGSRAYVVNLLTGEWGEMSYLLSPSCGIGERLRGSVFSDTEGLLFGSSSGSVYCGKATLDKEDGLSVTATWRSAPIGADLPGDYKQISNLRVDYRSLSSATLSLRIADDGNAFRGPDPRFNTTWTLSLASAQRMGRTSQDLAIGGPYPAIELASNSTGFSLQRLDVTIAIEGAG